MKYRVIGWTDFDDDKIEDGDNSSSAYNTIVDYIKEHGFCFSGSAHQNLMYCVPVLNDGKKRTFSERGWGGVMAEAHGYNGVWDYSSFAYYFNDDESEITPPSSLGITSDFTIETDLNEEIIVEVSEGVYEKAEKELLFVEYQRPELRYIDIDDTLTLLSNGKKASYKVIDLDKGWDLGDGKSAIEPILMHDMSSQLYLGDKAEKERLGKLHEDLSKRIFYLTLEKI